MGIFTKKLDIEKDHLRIVFNSDNQKYDVYYGVYLIPYNNLSRKSKKIINNKNNLLQTNPTLLEKELRIANEKIRFRKLQKLGYTCGSFEYLGKVKGTMSEEMEIVLNKLTTEENILLGIHRVKSSTSPEAIEDILINGLKMTGHNDGSVPNTNKLANNVSFYSDNKTIIKELMYADSFKNAKGSILIKIPDEDLSQNIYTRDQDGSIRLNPKYIVGYIPLEENHHIEKIITQNQTKTNYSQNSYIFKNNTTDIHYSPERKDHKTR